MWVSRFSLSYSFLRRILLPFVHPHMNIRPSFLHILVEEYRYSLWRGAEKNKCAKSRKENRMCPLQRYPPTGFSSNGFKAFEKIGKRERKIPTWLDAPPPAIPLLLFSLFFTLLQTLFPPLSIFESPWKERERDDHHHYFKLVLLISISFHFLAVFLDFQASKLWSCSSTCSSQWFKAYYWSTFNFIFSRIVFPFMIVHNITRLWIFDSRSHAELYCFCSSSLSSVINLFLETILHNLLTVVDKWSLKCTFISLWMFAFFMCFEYVHVNI